MRRPLLQLFEPFDIAVGMFQERPWCRLDMHGEVP